MKIRLTGVVLLALVLAAAAVLLSSNSDALAQDRPPEFRSIILQGNVAVAGQPAPTGLRITARIGTGHQSLPVTIGAVSPGRYVGIQVGPYPAGEGQPIEFWLEGQVKATETEVFAPRLPDGTPCVTCSWTLPISRTLNLTFSSAPQATPTPTPTLTPTAVILQPSIYSGRVLAGNEAPPDGTEIFAVVEDYRTVPARITGGRFTLVVNPVGEKYLKKNVEFFIGSFKAAQVLEFVPNSLKEDLILVFDPIPTPTPTLTPTPLPTATPTPTPTATPSPTPEPTRTPTPTPSPTPTLTPTATPTAIPQAVASPTARATAAATPTPAPTDGGRCNSRGGSAAMSTIGLLLVPVALAVWQRTKRRSRLE